MKEQYYNGNIWPPECIIVACLRKFFSEKEKLLWNKPFNAKYAKMAEGLTLWSWYHISLVRAFGSKW